MSKVILLICCHHYDGHHIVFFGIFASVSWLLYCDKFEITGDVQVDAVYQAIFIKCPDVVFIDRSKE
jgi:hypothetical protein